MAVTPTALAMAAALGRRRFHRLHHLRRLGLRQRLLHQRRHRQRGRCLGGGTFTDCTISGDSASASGGNFYRGEGGGIDNSYYGFGQDGGIDNQVGGTEMTTVTDCTIAGDSATNNGGGIENDGTLIVTDSTIADNQVASGGTGGGIDNSFDHSQMTLNNSLIALNTAGTGGTASASDIAGTVAAGAYNLIGTGGSGGLINGVNGNQVGVADPGLGTLANNGGPTQTIALLPGSPAIDAGSNALAVEPTTRQPLTTDQRGTGFSRIVNDTVDIGAFEFQPSPTAATHLAVTVQPPGTVLTGGAFGLIVSAEDSSGVVTTSFNGTVTVALLNNPGGATLGGTLSVTAQSGVAYLHRADTRPGRHRLHAPGLRQRPDCGDDRTSSTSRPTPLPRISRSI